MTTPIIETDAADSLKPGAKSEADPKALSSSKVSMMKSILRLTSELGPEDMTGFYTKAMALLGTQTGSDESGKNKATIGGGGIAAEPMPHLANITPGQTASEEMLTLFGSAELTEDFKTSVKSLFEAAVEAGIIMKAAEIQEDLEAKFEEAKAANMDELYEHVDKYVDDAVVEWFAENQVGIESQLRTEHTDEFNAALKNLFEEFHIDIPTDKVDIVDELVKKVADLEEALAKKSDELDEFVVDLVDTSKKELVEKLGADLAMTQKEKFASLAEDLEFTGDLDLFGKKLTLVKEQYFSKKDGEKAPIVEDKTGLDAPSELNEEHNANETPVDPAVARVAAAISRTSR